MTAQPHTDHMPGEGKAENRRSRLVRRATYLRDVKIPRSFTVEGRQYSEAELAAIRWALRVIDENWDSAVELVHRPADATPEEDN